MTERFTVFGANGFIGAALVAHLRTQGHEVRAATRDNWPSPDEALGHVIYAAGLTSKFAEVPFETVNAQTTLPAQILQSYGFSSFLYLSSTRVYTGANTTDEDAQIGVSPTDPQDIYALTKMTTECLCLSHHMPTVRVVRLSNVYGPFTKYIVSLAKILREAVQTGAVEFLSSPQSAKDYVSIKDVVRFCQRLRFMELIGSTMSPKDKTSQIAILLRRSNKKANPSHFVLTPRLTPANPSALIGLREFEAPQSKLLEDLPELLSFARQSL